MSYTHFTEKELYSIEIYKRYIEKIDEIENTLYKEITAYTYKLDLLWAKINLIIKNNTIGNQIELDENDIKKIKLILQEMKNIINKNSKNPLFQDISISYIKAIKKIEKDLNKIWN